MSTAPPPTAGRGPTTWQDGEKAQLLEVIAPHLEPVSFRAEDCLFRQGDVSDCFYLVDKGEVRLELRSDEADLDNESVLSYARAGSFVGEVGLLAGTPRSASAYAQGDVLARRMTVTTLEQLYLRRPTDALAVARLLGRDAALKLLASTERVAEHLFDDSPDDTVDDMVAAGVGAQAAFEGWPEERVDSLLEDVALSVSARAGALGEATVDETGLGDAGDKAQKITFASLGVYAALAGQTGRGMIADDPERKVRDLAGPVGVVFALAPLTEPVSTYVNDVLIALKGRNALIVSPHRGAQASTAQADAIVQDVLAAHGAPAGLVQLVRHRTSRQRTARFMRHEGVAMVLATGGSAMVKAAYSSGKPAIGVGPGNAPVWICDDADLMQAAHCVVESKAFDNGLVCGSEQHLVVDSAVRGALMDALRDAGAVVLEGEDSEAFVAAAFSRRGLRARFVGKPAAAIAASTGYPEQHGARLIAFTADRTRLERAYMGERLAPIVSLYEADGDDEAIDLCRWLLAQEGAGHTAVVHTASDDRIERFAAAMPVSRVLANVPAAQGCGGVLTGLLPSLTLGCGAWGGTSTTDNVGYRNLLNVKRVARMHMGNLLAARRLTSSVNRSTVAGDG